MVQGQVGPVRFGQLGVFGVILVDSVLDLVTVVFYQSLNGPGCCISQGTDCVAFDLFGQLPQHVNLRVLCFPDFHSFEGIGQPTGSFPAGGALTTTLMLVEFAQPENGFYHIGLLVHHDNCCSTQATLELSQGVEVHQDIITEVLGQKSDGGTSRDDGFEVVPASNNSSAVSIDKLSQRNGHFLLNSARIVDVP